MRFPHMTITRYCILALAAFALSTVTAEAQTKKPKKKSSTKAAVKTVPSTAPSGATQADRLDLSVKPTPLEATAFSFPPYEEFTMDNGLHVIVLENHEQSVVTFSVALRAGDAHDAKGKEGTISMSMEMLAKGTTSRTARQISESLDGVGASISMNVSGESTTVTASGLKKHADILLTTLSDELRNPVFPADELEKLRSQFRASIANDRSRASELSQALARKVIYGMEHPLARRASEQSIAGVTVDEIKATYAKFIMPNQASITVVGDVSTKEVKAWLAKHFGSWRAGEPPSTVLEPTNPLPQGVYFIPRKGSVQSAVVITTEAPRSTAPEFDAATILAGYIGGGFGSRLFATLRETHSYTYSPFGFVTRGRQYNRFAVGAEVRTSVTDSAILVILRELAIIGNEGPNEEQLQRRIASTAGQYKLAFENAGTVASLLQSAWLQGKPLSDLESQVRRIEGVTVGDVQTSAAEHFGIFDIRIVVVGDPAVRDKLEQFGTVQSFSLDVVPLAPDVFEAVSMSINDVVERYAAAIGGRAAIDAVKTLSYTAEASMSMRGQQFSGTYQRKQAVGNKEFVNISFPVMDQTQWVNGNLAWTAMGSDPAATANASETEQLVQDARMFLPLALGQSGFATVVQGIRDGKLVVDAVSATGRKERYFFDATSHLHVQTEREEQTPKGPITIIEKFDDYEVVSGVKLPRTISMFNPIYSITLHGKYQVNPPILDSAFTPASN